jgi:hypothetical protein
MMKTTGLLIACVALVVGCRTTAHRTEDALGVGRYAVDVPQVTAITGTNSNPTIWVHECGRIQVHVNSLSGNRRGDIWINWLDGTVCDETTERGTVEPPEGDAGKASAHP